MDEQYCLLCGTLINPWDSYKVLGLDWPGNRFRAHEVCIERFSPRWREIKHNARPPEPSETVGSEDEG